jgi:large subunit ribosomal protein L34
MPATTTYRPSKRKRARVTGFRKRNRTKDGQKILKRKRLKGRWRLTPALNKF